MNNHHHPEPSADTFFNNTPGFRWHALLCVVSVVCILLTACRADESAEEQRQQKINDRYLQLLKRNPRPGTALDRIYSFHQDRGSVDKLIDQLTADAQASPDDAAAWMTLGLMEARHGKPDMAAAAFSKAEQQQPDNSVASWLLGQALADAGNNSAAALALERALRKQPAKADQLEIYQVLGRLYQRQQQMDKALDLWKRFEAAFPNDLRVQEDVVSALIAAEQFEEAIVRLQKLVASTVDPARKIEFGLKIADVRLQQGQQSAAITSLQQMQDQLRPGSWQFNEVRQRIDDAWLKTGDTSALIEHYQSRLQTHPDDLDAMSRLGRYLDAQGITEEARRWLETAVQKAPSVATYRDALIEHLIRQKHFSAATTQFEQLEQAGAATADHYKRWGNLYMRRLDLSEDERRTQAAAVWRKLLRDRSQDPLAVSSVAELYRSAGMVDDAIQLYEQAIKLAPQDIQYREYLGEYFHFLKRPEDAKRAWQSMVSDDLQTKENFVRLSEIYHQFSYIDEAIAALQQACEQQPVFADHLKLAQWLTEARRSEEALQQLKTAESLARTEEQQQQLQTARIAGLEQSGQLESQIAELIRQLEKDQQNGQLWQQLAAFQEAAGHLNEAARSAQQSVSLAPESTAGWSLAARILERAGLIADAVDAYRRLADLDPRSQTEYLRQIAGLERRLGRIDAAVQAAEDAIAAAPENPESYRYLADLCFELGRTDQAIEALRRCVKVNPADTATLIRLGQSLADRFQTAEAIEYFWRAFERADELSRRISIVESLTNLHIRANQLNELTDRLRQMKASVGNTRDLTICLANVWRAAGDANAARQTLQTLVDSSRPDVVLLEELSALAEQSTDLQAAAEYQQQINDVSPSAKGTARLTNLLLRSGQITASEAMLRNLADESTPPAQILSSMDQLIESGQLDSARHLADQMLTRNPDDWETILRLIVIHWKQRQTETARQRCRQLLTLEASATSKMPATAASSSGSSPDPPFMLASRRMYALAQWLHLTTVGYRPQPGNDVPWKAASLTEATAMARCILLRHAIQTETQADLPDAELDAGETTEQQAWNLFFATMAEQAIGIEIGTFVPPESTIQALAQQKSVECQAALIHIRQLMSPQAAAVRAAVINGQPLTAIVETILPDDQASQLLHAWKTVSNQRPQWLAQLGGLPFMVTSLERSEKSNAAREVVDYATRPDASAWELESAIRLAQIRKDISQLLNLTQRLTDVRYSGRGTGSSDVVANLGHTFAVVASQFAAAEDWDSVRQVVIGFLQIKAAAEESQTASTGSSADASDYIVSTHHQIFVDGQPVRMQKADYLSLPEFWSASDITFLLNASELFRLRGGESLMAVLQQYRSTVNGKAAVVAETTMTQLCFLNREYDRAAVHLTRAAIEAPQQAILRLHLARYHQSIGNTAEALTVLDTITDAAHDVIRQKELLALNLATSLGNTDRSRTAAERLFGLRLDAKTSVDLSTRMKQLGLDSMAEAVMARLRKTSGNDLSALVELMQKEVRSGDTTTATEIAHQILRQSQGMTRSAKTGMSLPAIRRSAAQVLSDSGQLQPIIDRLVEQIQQTPTSVPLHETLLEYYVAANQSEQAANVREQLRQLQPVTIDTLLADAHQLEKEGNSKEACDRYLAVLKLDPQRYAQNYYTLLRTFRDGRKLPELADVLLKQDLRKLQNNYFVVNETVQALFDAAHQRTGSEREHRKALELFAQAWEAFPSNRTFLLGEIHDDDLWQIPAMLDYAKAALIPQTTQQALVSPWKIVTGTLHENSAGYPQGTLNRLISGILHQNQQTEFVTLLSEATSRFPNWKGGQLMLACLLGRTGNTAAAQDLLDELTNASATESVPWEAAVVAAVELKDSTDPLPTAVTRLLLQSLQHNTVRNNRPYEQSPTRILTELLVKQQQPAHAVAQLHRSIAATDFAAMARDTGTAEAVLQRRFVVTAARHLVNLSLPLDALRLLNPLTSTGDSSQDSRSQHKDIQIVQQLAEQRVTLTSVVQHLNSIANAGDNSLTPPLDLLLERPDSPTHPIRSFLLDATTKAIGKDSSAAETIRQSLQQLADRQPSSQTAVAVMQVVLEAESNNAELWNSGLERLNTVLNSVDVPPTSDDTTELAFWLAAQVVWKHGQHPHPGDALAERAERCATALPDSIWLQSMLHQRGHLAIAAGDQLAAEAAWTRLLDSVLATRSTTASGKQQSTTAEPTALQELNSLLLNQNPVAE